MKKIITIAIILAVVSFGAYYYFDKTKSEEIKYRTEKISLGNITVQVRATGTINPKRIVQVGSQVSGTIAQLFADFNSEVREGQIIAMIDSTFLNASVKEAEANLERTQAQVNESRRNVNRVKGLFEKGLVSQAELDKAQTDFETASAQFKQTQAALDRARVNLRYSVIRAPIDGIVISRDVDVGQTVAASLQAPKLFSIANDLQLMQVEASVDEADIGQISEGQNVTFTVDAYPEDEFHGKVRQVRIAPVTVQNVVTYTVIIEVPNPDLKLRPGMTATVSILIQEKENVLRVPSLALRFQPPKEAMDSMNIEEKKVPVNDRDINGQKPEIAEKKIEQHSSQMQPDDVSKQRRIKRDDWKNMSDEEREKFRTRREQMGKRGAGNSVPKNNGSEMNSSMRSERGERKMFKKKFGKVWIMRNGNELVSLRVKTGITDSRFVEIISDELKDGDEVIVGLVGPEIGVMGNGQTQNPFAPRISGGGGRGRGF